MSVPLTPGTVLSGRFEIEEEIGRGGMGLVFSAHDRTLGRRVALKLLNEHALKPSQIRRFKDEIRRAAQLDHPHILTVYDSYEHVGTDFYVTPLVEDGTLRSRLDREGRLSIAETTRIGEAVASALVAAHARDIVHRDVKPENILLGRNGHPYLIDFGIAISRGDVRLSSAHELAGSAHYMSPEQANEAPPDGRSDIYSLGCVLFEMLIGEPPFTGRTVYEVLAKRLTSDAPAPRSRRPDVPPTVDALVRRCLAREPGERFPDAQELQRALSAAAAATSSIVQEIAQPSVLVLPFRDKPSGVVGEHVCDRLVDEIISALGEVPGLRTVPRTTTFALRDKGVDEAAERLRVTHAVQGELSVSRRGDGLCDARVWLEEVGRERPLWERRMTFTLDGGRDDEPAVAAPGVLSILEVPHRVTAEVALALLGPGRAATGAGRGRSPAPRRDLVAVDMYWKGRHALNRRGHGDLRNALDFFRNAAARDDEYAEAHCGIAEALCLLGAFDYAAMDPGKAYPEAEAAARRALTLNPTLSAAHATLGNILASYGRQDSISGPRYWCLDAAEESYKEAVRLDPEYSTAYQWYSSLLVYRGKNAEALRMARMAVALEEGSAPVASNLARLLQLSGHPERAVEHYHLALKLDENLVTAEIGLALALVTLGHPAEGARRLGALVQRYRHALPILDAAYAYAWAKSGRDQGRNDEVAAWWSGVRSRPRPYWPPEADAIVCLARGDLEGAVAGLESARDRGSQVMTVLAVEPLLADLRRPGHDLYGRFSALLRQVGLVQIPTGDFAGYRS